MIHRNTGLALAGMAAVIAFTSCSSGGSDDPVVTTSTIESADARDLASVATSVGGLIDVASFPTDILMTDGPAAFMGGTAPEVIDCTDGGTITLTFTDTRPMEELSQGDGFEVEFADCSEGPTTTDGFFSFVINQVVENDPLAFLSVTLTVDQLTVVDAGTTISQNGTLSESIQVDTASGDYGFTLTGFFNSSFSDGGDTLTSNLSGLDLGYDYIADVEMEALRINCTYQSSVDFDTDFTITTLADLVSFGLDSNPTEGRLSIVAGGDTLFMTAQPDGINALLELDQGSDGSIDYTELVPWDEL